MEYSERVAVRPSNEGTRTEYSAYLDIKSPQRIKTSLEVKPKLKPVHFRTNMVCYIDSSKKRHRSTVYYEPRYTAVGFGETRYVLPQTTSTTIVSAVTSGNSTSGRRYRSSVTMPPKLYKHTMTYKFRMASNSDEGTYDYDDDSDDYSDSYSSSIYVQDIDPIHDHNGRRSVMIRRSSADNFLCDDSFSVFAGHNSSIRDSGYGERYTPQEEEMIVL